MKRLPITISLIVFLIVILFNGCDLTNIWGNKGAQSLSLSATEIVTDIADNKTFTITAETKDKDGATRQSSIVWTFSSPEKVQIIHKSNDTISFSITESGKFVLSAYDESNPGLTKAVVITATGALKAIYLSDTNITLDQKKEYEVSISFNPTEPSNKDVVWTSNNTEVARVVKTSETTATIISGIPGTATITVASTSNSSISASCRVTVSDIYIPPTDPRYMRLSSSYLEFKSVAGSETLTATVYDGNNAEKQAVIYWSSSDTTVANVQTVGKSVTVTPTGMGTATITAVMEGNEAITGKCEIIVGNSLQGLIISRVNEASPSLMRAASRAAEPQISGSFPIGQSVMYKVSYIPADTTQTGVTWSSSSDIISISPDGDYVTVKASKSGSALLTATSTKNMSVTAAASIGVYDPAKEPDNNISRISLDPYKATLQVNGESITIKASVYNQDGLRIDSPVVWNSENSNVEINTLASDGSIIEVIPKTNGLASITATSLVNPYVSAKASVYVLNEGEVPSGPQQLIASADSVTLVTGQSYDLQVSYLPADPESASITWSTSDSIIQVSPSADAMSATISAIKEGNAVITITSSALPDTPATVRVRVIRPEDVKKKVSSIQLSDTSLVITPPYSADQTGLTATSYDSSGNVVEDTYTWTNDNSNIISGRTYGNNQYILSPKSPGTARIVVRSQSNPDVSAVASVTASGGLSSIKLNPDNLTIAIGESVYVDATLVPSDTIQKNIQWSPSNDFISIQRDAVNPYRITLKGVKAGTSELKVLSTDNNEVQTTMKITVLANQISPEDPHYLKLSKAALSFNTIGQEDTLTATIYDGNNQEVSDVITWTSSNTDAVRVSSAGRSAAVSAVGIGDAIITATMEGHADITAECHVTVGNSLQGLVITQVQNIAPVRARSVRAVNPEPQISGNFPIGQTITYKVSYVPENTTQTGVSWSASSDIVSISPDGDYVTVKANKTGNALIIATSSRNASIAAAANVGVYDPQVEPDNNISEIALSPNTLTLRVGETNRISAIVYNQDGTSIISPLTWGADNSGVQVNVGDTGSYATITAKTAGTTTISVKSIANPYVETKATVLVLNENDPMPTEPQQLIASIASKTLARGNSFNVSLSYLPSTADNGTVVWSAGNDSIASVKPSADGMSATITGEAAGTTTITATSSLLSNKPVTITVKVVNPDEIISRVSSVILSDTSITLTPPFTTDQTGLTATSYDSSGNVVEDTYTWIIDNSRSLSGRVANETKQYILTPLRPGDASITVQSKNNPNIMATAKVSITGGLSVISLNPSTLKLSIGTNVSVTATLSPEDTVQTGVSWSLSGDAAKLTRDSINPYRVTIQGVSAGSATLKVSSTDNPAITTSCQITVLPSELPESAKVGSIELSATTLSIDPPITTPSILTAKVYDVDGLVFPTGVEWEVEDTSIAELSTSDAERVSIIAKKAGETRIIARSVTDPSVTKSCILTVSGKITSIKPEKTYLQIVNGESTELKVTLNPSNTIETDLIWETEGTTDGSTQVTPWVSLRPTASGCLITGIKLGQTTVTVRSKARPEVKAEIAVEVIEAPKVQATITLSPTPIELSPSSTRVKVTATVKTTSDTVINEDVVFRIDPASLVDTTVGGSNEIYLIPNGTAGEGTVYAYLPSYPHIEEGKARLFVGGQLRSLAASGAQSVAVNVGETASVSVVYNPENTTETGIIWTSSNSAVARVNGGNATDAIITGVSSGVATITATSKYYADVKVEFTVVVKSIINEVAFVDQYDNRGLIFNTDTTTPLNLTCYISPDIERKLVFKPKNNTFTMATLSGVDGTVNDVVFTPDPNAAGSYEYNITYDNKVVDTLVINTTFKGLAINTTREVFEGDYKSAQIRVTSESGEVSTDQLRFRSSDTSVASVSDQGLIKAVSPGEAIIYTTIGEGAQLETRVYVNVEIPESFEAALRATGYLSASGDTILPSQLNKITVLDLRQAPQTIAIDLSGIRKLDNLEELYISGTKLSSDTLNLYNSPKLRKLEANDVGITSITSVPKGIQEIYAQNNLLSSYSVLSNTDVRIINLANNQITSYTNLKFGKEVNLENNKITSLNVSSETIEKLNVSRNNISSVKIDSRTLKDLNLSSNNLWYSSISLTSNKQLTTPNLEILNLNNNYLGLYKDKKCPTDNGTYQGANASTYSENEQQNREQPLMSVDISWMPNLREIHLLNNHIRSGLSASDKSVQFRIYSPALQRIDIRGNHIGNNFSIQNSVGNVTSVPASSSYNINGMTISYDRGGCFYTSRTWYDYWDWFLQHKTGWNYAISHAYMY